jgi:predicted dehydrogenase
MTRIAVFGAGAMGTVHALAWARIDGAQLAGVVGRTPARANALAARLGVPALSDVRAVLDDPTIDAVDVTAPSALHRDLVTAALERGKHVFCETPLAPTVADVDVMAATACRTGRVLQVAALQRVADLTVEARAIVLGGTLGRPRVVTTERLWPGLDQIADATDHHGDALEELALFDFDWLVWTFGPPTRVAAHAAASTGAAVDHALASLDWGDHRALVEASRRLPESFPFRLGARVECEDGALEWTLRFPEADRPPDVRFMRYPRRGAAEPVATPSRDPYEAECRHFLMVLAGHADPALLSAESARDGLRLVEAARAAIAANAPVTAAG